MRTLLVQRMSVRPDVARSGQRAVSVYLDGSSGEPVLVMLTRAQAADLAKALTDALKRELRQ